MADGAKRGSDRGRRQQAAVLRLVEYGLGADGFALAALARLAAGDNLYGDRWMSLGLDRLLDELTEEAADIGGWGSLAIASLELDAELGLEGREALLAALIAVLRAGAEAYGAIKFARSLLENARQPPIEGHGDAVGDRRAPTSQAQPGLES